MKNKTKVIIGAVAIGICVVSIVVACVHQNTNKKDNINITTVTQDIKKLKTNEKEYSFMGDNNKKYFVKKDGMYCEGEEGLMKVEPFINISPVNTYKFSYENGSECSIAIKDNGEFEMITKYPDETYLVNKGIAQITNGFDDSLKALNMKEPKDLAKEFQIPIEIFNPNNLYHITLPCDSSKNYDKDGKEIIYDDLESYDSSEQTQKYIAQDLVIFLDNNDNVQTDKDGKKYYDINCSGYSTMYRLFYADWSVNGPILVENPFYIESEE